jgi:hypothetical protein
MSQKKTSRHQSSLEITAKNAVITSAVPSRINKEEANKIIYFNRI